MNQNESIIIPKYHEIIDIMCNIECLEKLDCKYMGRCFGNGNPFFLGITIYLNT